MPHAEWTLFAQDFRALRKVNWSPSGVCLLSGPNGAGKTSVLDALEFLRTAVDRGVREAVRLAGGGALLRRLGAEPKAPVWLALSIGDLMWEIHLPVDGGGIHPNHGELLQHGSNVLARRAMFDTDVFLANVAEPPAGILHTPGLAPQPLNAGNYWNADERSILPMLWDKQRRSDLPPEVAMMIDLVRGIRVYKAYRLDQIREPQSGVDVEAHLLPSGRNVWNVLRNWKAAPRKYRDQFRWVVEALREAFPEIVLDLEFETEGQTVVGRFYPPNAPTASASLPLSLAADGLLVGILHLTAVAGAPEGSILAFDEMENQLHPHAIRAILKAMRTMSEERDLTIVLTTHSPIVMNEFKGHEDQFYVLEAGHEELPVPLDKALDPDWLAHFSLGDLYDREDFAAQKTRPVPSHAAE